MKHEEMVNIIYNWLENGLTVYSTECYSHKMYKHYGNICYECFGSSAIKFSKEKISFLLKSIFRFDYDFFVIPSKCPESINVYCTDTEIYDYFSNNHTFVFCERNIWTNAEKPLVRSVFNVFELIDSRYEIAEKLLKGLSNSPHCAIRPAEKNPYFEGMTLCL